MDTKPTTERNLNFELLRIIAMFMVVMLHVNLFGGLLSGYKPTLYPVPFLVSNFIEFLCIIAPNLYVLISGYFLSNKKYPFKIEKLFYLILVTCFWSWMIGLVSCLFLRANIGDFLFNGIFPVLSRRYWFVTDYIVLYMLSPFYNIILQNINKAQHIWLLIVLLLFFSVAHLLWEPINLNKGYSLYWFSYLYVQASFIRKYDLKIHIKTLVFIWGVILIIQLVGIYYTMLYELNFMRIKVFNFNYNSLFVLINSTCCFLLFKSLTIKKGKSIIGVLSSLTFGIYLIHINPTIISWLFKQVLPIKTFAGTQPFSVLLSLLLFTILIFSVSCLLEYFRKQLFLLCRVHSKIESLSFYIERKLRCICRIVDPEEKK